MKKLLIFLLAVFCTPLAFAQFHLLPTADDHIQQWFQASYGRSVDLGFEAKQNFFSVGYAFDITAFDGFVGLQCTDDVTDFAFDSDWWPFEFHKKHGVLRFGLGLDYHAEWYNDISCEHDIILMPELDWHSTHHYLLTLRTGGTRKISDIYAIDQTTVDNWNLLLTLRLGKIWDNGIEATIDAGTRTQYRHPVFGSAIFTPAVAYRFANGVRVGLEAEITMRDWIAATYYMESVIIRCTGRVTF